VLVKLRLGVGKSAPVQALTSCQTCDMKTVHKRVCAGLQGSEAHLTSHGVRPSSALKINHREACMLSLNIMEAATRSPEIGQVRRHARSRAYNTRLLPFLLWHFESELAMENILQLR
jgi:hypothetical protein